MTDSAFTPLLAPRVGETPIDIRGEAARARTRGYADGFAEGRRIALDQAQHQQAVEQTRMQELRDVYLHERGSALRALAVAQSDLDRRVDELVMLAVERVEDLAIELATVILGVELSEPARSAAHALRRALAEVPAGRWTRISFSERDFRTLEADSEALGGVPGVEMVDAAAVDDGGAIVEVENGAVDTRVSAALLRAADALRGPGESDAGAIA